MNGSAGPTGFAQLRFGVKREVWERANNEEPSEGPVCLWLFGEPEVEKSTEGFIGEYIYILKI